MDCNNDLIMFTNKYTLDRWRYLTQSINLVLLLHNRYLKAFDWAVVETLHHRYLTGVDWAAVEVHGYRYLPTRQLPAAAQWDVWTRARAIAACLARLRGSGGVRDPMPRQLSGRRPRPRRHPRRPPQPWRAGDCAPPPSTTRWLLGHPHGRRP